MDSEVQETEGYTLAKLYELVFGGDDEPLTDLSEDEPDSKPEREEKRSNPEKRQ